MLKKAFMAPFWWMLIMGIIAAAISIFALLFLLRRGYPMSWPIRLSFFYLSAIMFIEAMMYLTIRRRMINRRDVWSHLLLFTAAYVFNFLMRSLIPLVMARQMTVRGMTTYMRVINSVELYVFWGLVIGAHFFFARVLIKAFAKPPVVEGGGEKHLLDDVLD